MPTFLTAIMYLLGTTFGIGIPTGIVLQSRQNNKQDKIKYCHFLMRSANLFKNTQEVRQNFYTSFPENKDWKWDLPKEEALNSVISVYKSSEILRQFTYKICPYYPSIDYLTNFDMMKSFQFFRKYNKNNGGFGGLKYNRHALLTTLASISNRNVQDIILNMSDEQVSMFYDAYFEMMTELKKMKLIDDINEGVDND